MIPRTENEKKLRDALAEFYLVEYTEEISDEAFDDLTDIGIAFTTYCEVNGPEHEAYVALNLAEMAVIYYLDKKEVYREEFETIDEIAAEIKNSSFDEWTDEIRARCPFETE